MKTTVLRFFFALLCLTGGAFAQDQAKLDALFEKAMKGYNADDPKAFFADYASSMASLATPEMYKMMISDPHKAKLGKYVSKTLNAAETSLNEEAPLVVYKAKFEKGAEVKVGVNFMKEAGTYKIMQIAIAP